MEAEEEIELQLGADYDYTIMMSNKPLPRHLLAKKPSPRTYETHGLHTAHIVFLVFTRFHHRECLDLTTRGSTTRLLSWAAKEPLFWPNALFRYGGQLHPLASGLFNAGKSSLTVSGRINDGICSHGYLGGGKLASSKPGTHSHFHTMDGAEMRLLVRIMFVEQRPRDRPYVLFLEVICIKSMSGK